MQKNITAQVLRRHRSRLAMLGVVAAAGVLAIGLSSALGAKGAAKPAAPPAAKPGEAPKYTIEEVMKKGYKGENSLVKRIINGKVTKDEAQLLLELNVALAANTPDKGDAGDWKQRTGALVRASEAINKGDRAGLAALRTASDCKGCHRTHKSE